MATMWLVFAFSGPVLWAASMHIDKYLVELSPFQMLGGGIYLLPGRGIGVMAGK